MSTELTIPTSTKTAIKPKPTRAEVIDALTDIKMEKFEREHEERTAKKEKLMGLLEKNLIRHAKKVGGKSSVRLGYRAHTGNPGGLYYAYGIEVRTELDWKDIPEQLKTQILEYHELDKVGGLISRKRCREVIAASVGDRMDRSERVAMLLQDKESRTALESLLSAIEGKK